MSPPGEGLLVYFQGAMFHLAQVLSQHIPVPMHCFSHIHVDLAGPPFQHQKVSPTCSLSWTELLAGLKLYPLLSPQKLRECFVSDWVSRFGIPAVIISTCLTSSASRQQKSNVLVECFHRPLKDGLWARCAAANWMDHLPCLLLGLRLAAREDNNTTPAQAVFGSPLILPGQFLDSLELPSVEFLEQFLKH